jgi:hypothetical protein
MCAPRPVRPADHLCPSAMRGSLPAAARGFEEGGEASCTSKGPPSSLQLFHSLAEVFALIALGTQGSPYR